MWLFLDYMYTKWHLKQPLYDSQWKNCLRAGWRDNSAERTISSRQVKITFTQYVNSTVCLHRPVVPMLIFNAYICTKEAQNPVWSNEGNFEHSRKIMIVAKPVSVKETAN